MPERRCVGCGRRANQGELVRAVVISNRLVVDARRRFSGRGANVCPRLGCVARGIERGTFARTLGSPLEFHNPVETAQDMLSEIRESYERLVAGARRGGMSTVDGSHLLSEGSSKWMLETAGLQRQLQALMEDEAAGWILPKDRSGKRQRKAGQPELVVGQERGSKALVADVAGDA